MESNRKLRKGIMKAKLSMNFYRAAKSPPPTPYSPKPKPNHPPLSNSSGQTIWDKPIPQPKQNIASPTASVGFIVNQDQVTPQPKQNVSFVIRDGGPESYRTIDSPYGAAGDESINLRAASYISCVQERFRLERLNSKRNMSQVAQDMH